MSRPVNLDADVRQYGPYPDLDDDEYDATTDPRHWMWNPLTANHASEGEWKGLSQLLGKMRMRRSTLKAYRASKVVAVDPVWEVPVLATQRFGFIRDERTGVAG